MAQIRDSTKPEIRAAIAAGAVVSVTRSPKSGQPLYGCLCPNGVWPSWLSGRSMVLRHLEHDHELSAETANAVLDHTRRIYSLVKTTGQPARKLIALDDLCDESGRPCVHVDHVGNAWQITAHWRCPEVDNPEAPLTRPSYLLATTRHQHKADDARNAFERCIEAWEHYQTYKGLARD